MSERDTSIRIARRVAVIVAATAAGALWLHGNGPVKVIIGSTEIDEFAPTWYMLAAFPVLGMVAADVLDAALQSSLLARRTVLLGAGAALVVVLANLRLGIRIPISGHSLLLAYWLRLRMLLDDSKPSERSERIAKRSEELVALALLLAVGAMKTFHWHDPTTLVSGFVAGIVLARAVAYFLKTPRTPPATSAVTSRSTDGSESPPGVAR